MALSVRYQASTLACQPARAAHPVAPAPGSSGPAKRADDIDVGVDVDVDVGVWKVPTLQCSALPCAAHPLAPAPSTHARTGPDRPDLLSTKPRPCMCIKTFQRHPNFHAAICQTKSLDASFRPPPPHALPPATFFFSPCSGPSVQRPHDAKTSSSRCPLEYSLQIPVPGSCRKPTPPFSSIYISLFSHPSGGGHGNMQSFSQRGEEKVGGGCVAV